MKAVCVFLLAIAATTSAYKLFHGDEVIRTFPHGDQKEVLQTIVDEYNLDFWSDLDGFRPVDIHVPRIYVPIVRVILSRNLIEHETFIEDLQTAIDQQTDRNRPAQKDLASFDYSVYHTYDEIDTWVTNMAAEYPDVVSKYTAGTSYEGLTFYGLKIARGTTDNPAFYINCGIHAREWISQATCLNVVKYLATAQEGSAEYSLLQSVDFYVVPSANPDGYKYTWTGDRMWRKTRSDTGHVCMGVDPNRNWDINFGGAGTSTNPCNDAYCGPSAFSEVEVTSLRDAVMNTPKIAAFIDIHAYSQYFMYPYGYTRLPTTDAALLSQIGDEAAAAIKATHGETYEAGQISRIIYEASGSTADWFYDIGGVHCAFGAELRDTGRYGFTLPERFIAPTSEETFAALKVVAGYVADGSCPAKSS